MRESKVRGLARVHRITYRMTAGLIGRRLVDNDMLLLTTTGRRSGRPHTVPLLYLREGHRFIIIASCGGRPHHPEWYLNLETNPMVEVQVGHRRFQAAAAASRDDRAIWWPQVLSAYAGYAEYQSRTDRPIPVVFLDPRRPAFLSAQVRRRTPTSSR